MDKVIITVQDMNILLIFPGFILAFIIVCYYKLKMKNMYAKIDAAYNNKNIVHFYVARDMDGNVWLYIGKPNRSVDWFEPSSNEYCVVLTDNNFEVFGLNENDYKDLKWEDEPVEVFLNMED